MPRTLLLAANNQNSIIVELAGGGRTSIAYSAYGRRSAQQAIATHLGFNGDLSERHIGWYLLGNGYRAYNPVLMCFHSPDSLSPFGEGGLNAYGYCAGDPVNFSDPTGHMLSLSKIFGKLKRNPVKGASSSSSLSPLIPDPDQAVSTVASKRTNSTIPALTRETVTEKIVTKRNFIAYGPSPETPPRVPSKQKRLVPRFNDTGGQVSSGNREVWRSEPFQFTSAHAPAPSSRTRGNVTLKYYVRYDETGYPTLSQYELGDLRKIQNEVRRTAK